ncbi:glycosyltransferase family 8 protein [Malassezia pachydermatis]|uniref:Glycosyltransferase family 8 protein n=1 Tax=Malassezia pachydermatis TaxID=77020 RepID=A0A0M9VNT4_9BASI|nr:glycosyltransferase family 8 protein [Malassezia pachydermatis]KOS13699.1 glycosyltransferase family 8 protein [Malassezia pachydermatis]
MITPSVDASTRDILRKLGCRLRDVEPWDISTDTEILAHARFTNVWTKLRAMELFEYDRVVLIDSDMLVMQNMDELMDLTLAPGTIAAGMACTCNPNGIPTYPSDWVPDNCGFQLPHPPRPEELERPTHHLLNSGLVVMEPSAEQAKALHTYVHMHPERVSAYRFPDQDLLADVYRGKYTPLPWYYNALKTIRRCHENIWDDGQVRNIHYILEKPWHLGPLAPHEDADAHLHLLWWEAYQSLASDPAAVGLTQDDWATMIAPHVNESSVTPI